MGRGKSYVGDAQPQLAATDYETAIELDADVPEYYLELAEVYTGLDWVDRAIELLRRAIKRLGDLPELTARLAELGQMGDNAAVTVEGYIIANMLTYKEPYFAYIEQYQNPDSEHVRIFIATVGVRFDPAVTTLVDGETVTISEALIGFQDDQIDILQDLYEPNAETCGPLLEVPLRMVGVFSHSGHTEVFTGPVVEEDGWIAYHFNPNGEYCFTLQSFELID